MFWKGILLQYKALFYIPNKTKLLDENLLVGTRQGHLLMYRVVATTEEKHDVELMRYNKSFSKKAIQQLEVIPDYHLLVSLTGKPHTKRVHKAMHSKVVLLTAKEKKL